MILSCHSRRSDRLPPSLGAVSTNVAVFALVLAYAAVVFAWLALRNSARLRRSGAGSAPGETVVPQARVPDDLLNPIPGSLQTQLEELKEHVDATSAAVFQRMEEARPDPNGALSHVALVRYDAFHEMSGRMSFSLALLDNLGDGVTITALAGTGSTSVYAKGVRGGQGEHDLSPEEQQAVSTALRRPRPNLLGRRAS